MGDINRDYYGIDSPGRADYWRLMAAPRSRMRLFLAEIQRLRPRSVVDLGCGNGLLLSEVQARCPEAHLCGIDFSEPLLAADRRAHPAIAWHRYDLDGPCDFPAELLGSFDVVIASEIIEHLGDPLAFLGNAARLAKPDAGTLLLSTQSGRVWETERLVGHRRHFSAEAMRDLLHRAGWRPQRVWNAGWPFHDLAKFFANIRPERTMQAYSGAPYTPAQRAVCALLRLAYRFNARRRGAQLFAVARREGDAVDG